jgi:cytochrome c biogenesis protein CcmG, thiol:disulfide interchange protein DsbE
MLPLVAARLLRCGVPLITFRRVAALTSAVLLGLMAHGCSKGQDPDLTGARDATPDAPVVKLLREPAAIADFTVTDLDGKTVSSAALRGKVVFVNFWATWCPPCREEIPDLIRLQAKYPDQVVVLGISEDELPVESVRAFVASQKINYFVAMTTPDLAKVFRGVSALPTTFVLDREGKLVQRHVGQLNAANTELEAQVLAGLNVNARIERVADPARARLENAAQATEIPGVDLTKLSAAKRTEAIKALNAQDCTCGCGLTLAECRINDPECGISLPLARTLVEKIAGSI